MSTSKAGQQRWETLKQLFVFFTFLLSGLLSGSPIIQRYPWVAFTARLWSTQHSLHGPGDRTRSIQFSVNPAFVLLLFPVFNWIIRKYDKGGSGPDSLPNIFLVSFHPLWVGGGIVCHCRYPGVQGTAKSFPIVMAMAYNRS